MFRIICSFALLVLTGCSSGGGGGGDTLSRAEQAETLSATLEATNVTEPANLPTSGAANYDGFMTARLPTGSGGGRREYLGDLSMSVDFAAARNQVSGRATNFAAGSDTLGGVLVIQGGDLFRNTVVDENYTFSGNVDGTLRSGNTPFVIDAEIAGEFRGRNQEGVSGVLFGDVVGPNGQDIFDGTFFAEQP